MTHLVALKQLDEYEKIVIDCKEHDIVELKFDYLK